MAEPGYDELRVGFERVKKERDDYRAMAADMLKRHFDTDLDELEADSWNWKEKGGIPVRADSPRVGSRVRDQNMSSPDPSPSTPLRGGKQVRVLIFRAVRCC